MQMSEFTTTTTIKEIQICSTRIHYLTCFKNVQLETLPRTKDFDNTDTACKKLPKRFYGSQIVKRPNKIFHIIYKTHIS